MKMRGGIIQRGKRSFALVISRGYVVDPATGRKKLKQVWVSFKGTRRQAEKRRAELLTESNRGRFVEPSTIAYGDYLTDWLRDVVTPTRRARTHELYRSAIDTHIRPVLGVIRLQMLTAADLQRLYASKADDLAPSSLTLLHAINSSALAAAEKQGLVSENVARRVVAKPKVRRNPEATVSRSWTVDEARKAIRAAIDIGPQTAALVALALDAGCRKSELCGLRWQDVDLDAAHITVARQLTNAKSISYGPPKAGAARKIDISAQTIALLKTHKASQAALKMKHRDSYNDGGLVFCREEGVTKEGTSALGLPLIPNVLGQMTFQRVITKANVRRIRFHDLRHTSATLLLSSGTPVATVSQRLGHSKTSITHDVYSHALPGEQAASAARLGKLLHG